MQLNNLPISTRLVGLSAILLLGSLLLGLVAWSSLSKTNDLLQLSLSQAAAAEDAVNTARKAQVTFKIQIQEWKNILVRGHDAQAFNKYREAFVKTGQETQDELIKLQQIFSQLGLETPKLAEARQALTTLQASYLLALKEYDQQRLDSTQTVDALVKGMDRAPTQQIDEIVAYVGEHSARIRAENQASAQQQYSIALTIMLLALLVLMASGTSLTYWIISGVTRPLHSAIDIAKTVASGDLTAQIVVGSSDETGQLLQALKEMNNRLTTIVSKVRQGTDTIATGSSEIASGNLDLSSRTEEQASALEETASSMEQITSAVKQNADNARHANSLVSSSAEIAVRGGKVVAQVVSTMASINEASRRVEDIISVIDGIAFQTNILALNAAVEAARAGEHGRGFAVVASEVRGLAQRSAVAAKEIKELIANSVARVDAGEKLVEEAGATMQEIVDSVKRVTSIMSEISSASQEQSSGIDQVNIAISQMDEVTQQNAALVEQAAAAAASLQDQADQLAQTVAWFKVNA